MNEPPRIYNISYGFSFHSPSSDDRGYKHYNKTMRASCHFTSAKNKRPGIFELVIQDTGWMDGNTGSTC